MAFAYDSRVPYFLERRNILDIERCVSLELYNPEYWKRDALSVAEEGRRKTLAVIERALG